MWESFKNWWLCLFQKSLQTQPHHKTSTLPLINHQNDDVPISTLTMVTSWLNRRRWRYLLLILFTPLLLPLFCATCPFICALEICRRRRRAAARGRRRREEDGEEVGLLQRYLDDQLMLVGEPVGCDWRERGVDGVDVECFTSVRTVLQ